MIANRVDKIANNGYLISLLISVFTNIAVIYLYPEVCLHFPAMIILDVAFVVCMQLIVRYRLNKKFCEYWMPFSEYFGRTVGELQTLYYHITEHNSEVSFINHTDIETSYYTLPVSIDDAILITTFAPDRITWSINLCLHLRFESDAEIDKFVEQLIGLWNSNNPARTLSTSEVEAIKKNITDYHKISFTCRDINQWDMWRRFATVSNYIKTRENKEKTTADKNAIGEFGMRSIIFILRDEASKHTDGLSPQGETRLDHMLTTRYLGKEIILRHLGKEIDH